VDDAALLTSAQVLALLQIGRTKLWELVRAGELPAYRIGSGRNGVLRFRRDEVMRWLDRTRVAHAPRAQAHRPTDHARE